MSCSCVCVHNVYRRCVLRFEDSIRVAHVHASHMPTGQVHTGGSTRRTKSTTAVAGSARHRVACSGSDDPDDGEKDDDDKRKRIDKKRMHTEVSTLPGKDEGVVAKGNGAKVSKSCPKDEGHQCMH